MGAASSARGYRAIVHIPANQRQQPLTLSHAIGRKWQVELCRRSDLLAADIMPSSPSSRLLFLR